VEHVTGRGGGGGRVEHVTSQGGGWGNVWLGGAVMEWVEHNKIQSRDIVLKNIDNIILKDDFWDWQVRIALAKDRGGHTYIQNF
jgi:hypothetical protein